MPRALHLGPAGTPPLVDSLGISLKPPETSRQIQVTMAKQPGKLELDSLLEVSKGLRLVSGSGTR